MPRRRMGKSPSASLNKRNTPPRVAQREIIYKLDFTQRAGTVCAYLFFNNDLNQKQYVKNGISKSKQNNILTVYSFNIKHFLFL